MAISSSSPDAVLSTKGANLFEIAPQQLGKVERPPTFVTITNHLNNGYVVVVNSAAWSKLPSSFRDRFAKALEAAYDFNTRDLENKQVALLNGAPGNAAVFKLAQVDRTEWQPLFDSPGRGATYELLVAQIKSAPVPQLVSSPPPPAKISWNAWLEDSSGKDVEALTVGKVSTINLDLGRLPYKRRLTAIPDPRVPRPPGASQELRLLIQPIVLGEQLEAAPTKDLSAKIVSVSFKNAQTLPTDEATRQSHWDGSLDGQVVIEHGHQIGADVNSFSGWPRVTKEKGGTQFLQSPWGERFVQELFNAEEKKYPNRHR